MAAKEQEQNMPVLMFSLPPTREHSPLSRLCTARGMGASFVTGMQALQPLQG